KFNKNDLIINPSIRLGSLFAQFSFSPILYKKTQKKIKDFNPDIIHIHEQLLVSYQVLRFAKRYKYLTLISLHGDPYKFRAQQFPLSLFIKESSIFNRLLRKFQFSMLKNSDFVTTPTYYYQSLISKQLHKKAFVLPSPVSSYFFKKKGAEESKKINKLITMSRLAGEKHVDVLIEMMQYLKNKFSLTIMGEGIDKKFLMEKAKKLHLNNVITFIGWVTKKVLSETLRNHNLFLSASNFETFGITYIEALASKLPCVVYDYSVSREVIPNEMAIFVDSLDPKKWAKTLLSLQQDPDLYYKLKQNIKNNYQKIYQYNEAESAKRLATIYENISHNPSL
ncbi:glycosyltransferase, partial [Candidatus Roizmanbacteria bacterium]|nr:glycosyltransferase [Candidatus Roizmanbacteria bacterium]